jgi:hypothetical protein
MDNTWQHGKRQAHQPGIADMENHVRATSGKRKLCDAGLLRLHHDLTSYIHGPDLFVQRIPRDSLGTFGLSPVSVTIQTSTRPDIN